MYQHARSSIVHIIMACGAADKWFSGGNQSTADYKQVKEVPFLALRKCKRCILQARPVKDVEALASAPQKQRIERAEG